MAAKKKSTKDSPNKGLKGQVNATFNGSKFGPAMGPTAKQPTGPVGKQVGATTGKKKSRRGK